MHAGTIAARTLRETVLILSGWRERGFHGRSCRMEQDVGAEDLPSRLHRTLDLKVEVLEHQFDRTGVRTVRGEARSIAPQGVEVKAGNGDAHAYTGEFVLIARGPSGPTTCPSTA